MTIKSKEALLIYRGCVLCETIEDFVEQLNNHSECKKVLSDGSVKRMLVMKERWLDVLSDDVSDPV